MFIFVFYYFFNHPVKTLNKQGCYIQFQNRHSLVKLHEIFVENHQVIQ